MEAEVFSSDAELAAYAELSPTRLAHKLLGNAEVERVLHTCRSLGEKVTHIMELHTVLRIRSAVRKQDRARLREAERVRMQELILYRLARHVPHRVLFHTIPGTPFLYTCSTHPDGILQDILESVLATCNRSWAQEWDEDMESKKVLYLLVKQQ